HRVVEMLEESQAISKIAKEVNLTRLTVYRITILFWFYKRFFNVSQNK
ncbi:helix-turn-helix domain-containing protein, partial [Staphylococcus epidermidis]